MAGREGRHAAAALEAFNMLYMQKDHTSRPRPPSSSPSPPSPRPRKKKSRRDGGRVVRSSPRELPAPPTPPSQHDEQQEEEASEVPGAEFPDDQDDEEVPEDFPVWVYIERQDVKKPDGDLENLSRKLAKHLRYEKKNLQADSEGWCELGHVAQYMQADEESILAVAAHSWHPGQAAYRFEISKYGQRGYLRAAWSKSGGQVVENSHNSSSCSTAMPSSSSWSGRPVVLTQGRQQGQEQGKGSKGPVIPDRPLNQGEWKCAACGNLNFKGREKCFFRGCPTNPFKAGDWVCSHCSTHNYRRNSACYRCGKVASHC